MKNYAERYHSFNSYAHRYQSAYGRSAATGIMSSHGGSVTADSFCAIAQSIGAIGVSTSVYVGACIAGAMAVLFEEDATSLKL